MRYITTLIISCCYFFSLNAQQNDLLINSGELIEQAIKLSDNGKYKDAIAIYKKIRRGDTNYYRAVYEMAYSQLLDSQFTAARQSCETGLAYPNENWPELFTLYANILDDQGETDRSLQIYDSAIHRYPAYAELYLNKGTTYMKLNKFSEAEKIFKECLLINPYQASSHFKLGQCALQQGKVVQAFLSNLFYLLLQPSGRYQTNCVNLLSSISKADDTIKEVIQKRTEEPNFNFSTIEKIILSKIALDNQYKLLLKLDDPITRQIQVLFEKLEYDKEDQDFWVQFYVPFFKKIYDDKKFEPFINRIFSGLKIESIQDYVKKKDKAISEVTDEAVIYCDQIKTTREINYATRKDMNTIYHFSDGKLIGKGTAKNNGETLVGDWEFYFTSGNIKARGSYNDNGEKINTWNYYHFNGKLRGTQTFKNGKLEGDEIFYFENGLTSSYARFKDNLEDGTSKSFYLMGSPRTVVQYKAGKINGERRIFFANGNLQSLENFQDDSLHGNFKTYHANGIQESEGTYKNGKLEGPYKEWYDDGQTLMESNYRDGKLTGPLKQYYENGKIKIQETTADGFAEGDYSEYYDNGQLFYKCINHKGNPVGDVEYFDTDGKRISLYSYDNGVIKIARYFDKSGKEISNSQRKAKKLDLITYYPDGFKRSQGEYNDKGETIGKETYFYRSGKPSSEIEYEKGELHGASIYYHPNGNINLSTYYNEGKKQGHEKNWYSNGQLQEEGWLKDGLLQGTWISFDELGNLTSVSDYLDNELNGYKEEYFPNGKKDDETKYNLGWIEEFVQFDTMGKEIYRCSLPQGTGYFKVVFFDKKTYGEGKYLNGTLEGPYKFYFFDGKLNTIQFYKKGMLDSTYRNYYYDGTLSIEGQYRLGQKQGLWKTYFVNGKLNSTEIYENDELTGKKVYYYENGKVDTEIEFEKGERNGWTKKYDDDGSFMYQTLYRYDLPVAYTYLDKTGKLIPEVPIIGGSGIIKTYYMNGNLSADFGFAEGKLDGMNTIYHSNGKIKIRGMENYSLSEGSYKTYHMNGQLQYDYNYVHNNLHGPYKEYTDKGVLVEEGTYFNGVQHGDIKLYDTAGKLKETRTFYYGKLLHIQR